MQILTPDADWQIGWIAVSLDVVGYTQKMISAVSSTPPAPPLITLNKAIANLVRDAVENAGGTVCQNVFKLTGDGALLVFDEPNRASQFAAEAHSLTTDLKYAGENLTLRIGMADGDLLRLRDANICVADVFGMCVIDACRFEGNATTGETFVSDGVYGRLSSAEQGRYGHTKSFHDKHGIAHSGMETPSTTVSSGPNPPTAAGSIKATAAAVAQVYTVSENPGLSVLLNEEALEKFGGMLTKVAESASDGREFHLEMVKGPGSLESA